MSKVVLRPMHDGDIGRVAYLMLKWDNELPEHLKRLKGNIQQAELAASAFAGDTPGFHGVVLEVDGKVVGGYGVHTGHSIFSPKPYAQLVCWFVDRAHRGAPLHGLRLLREAIKECSNGSFSHLEVYPWSDDENTCRVLERLGFFEAVRVYIRRN